MNNYLKTLTGILFAVSVTGCSAINLLFDDANVFVRQRESEIGKPLSKVLKSEKYYYYWEGQSPHIKQEYKVVPLGDNLSEYQFSHGTCQWALIVSDDKKIVTKWRYIQKTSACGYKMFYEGPF